MSLTCPDFDTPNTLWSFCPNIAADYTLAVFFGCTTIAHFVQAILYKKAYCWVIVMSGTAQTIAYIFRAVSILNPVSFGDYAAWFVLILIAPLFTNAFAYMVMGRMVWNFIPDAKIWKVSAWRMGMLFVLLDIMALVIQIYGAATASTGPQQTEAETLKDLHIYMIGVGVQQGFILLFLCFAIKFHRIILHIAPERTPISQRKVLSLLYILYAVLFLITTRIVFRICEYSQGLTSTIPNHEVYQYCLDTAPMLIALVLLNVVHPGRIMPGKKGDLPGRKERKQIHRMANRDTENLPLGPKESQQP